MRGSIEVGAPEIVGRRVVFPLKARGSRARRLLRSDFWSEYSFPLAGIPPQILAIPVVANLLPLSWAEDFEISVPLLDATYLEACAAMRRAWSEVLPDMARGGRLVVNRAETTTVKPRPGAAVVLFGGGVDSVASVLRHESEDLHLCSLWGVEVPVGDRRAWDRAEKHAAEFAARHGASTSTIRTNALSFVNAPMLDRKYSPFVAYWWRAYSGLGLLGMAAPAAIAHGAETVYMAASHTAAITDAWPTRPSVDEAVRFGQVRCIHDGYDLSRVEKLRLIHEKDPHALLKVCQSGAILGSMNCGRCEKCIRTAVGFHLLGIDPGEHGLEIEESSFDSLRRRISRRTQVSNAGMEFFWRDLQTQIPASLAPMPPAVRRMIDWLREQDLPAIRREWRLPLLRRVRQRVARLLPHRLRPLGRRIYLRVFRRWE
jgi:7-cyano-7-deazaguanine synthase in queuosine biosynthesis